MAAIVERLGAQDRRAPIPGEGQELGDPLLELGRLHVVGVATKRVVAPGEIARVLARLAQSAQPGQTGVDDAGHRERFLESLGVELRVVARARDRPDVGQTLDSVGLQDCQEGVERPVGMSDREDRERHGVSG